MSRRFGFNKHCSPGYTTGNSSNGAGDIVRDSFGNATGGIRPSVLEAPVGNHFPLNAGPIPICALSGSFFAFDSDMLQSLYPNHGLYVSKVAQSANALLKDGYLLADDARNYKTEAAHSSVGH